MKNVIAVKKLCGDLELNLRVKNRGVIFFQLRYTITSRNLREEREYFVEGARVVRWGFLSQEQVQ